ncbi:uncharacterized protein LOC142973244 [Anticarsia gemmatalis]|uniref:uncharacterized protein LOC142973244 n=1 Tax=Anticarsia gemmatalis TaxID=129554 RepID=UPI003F76DE5A
MNGPNSTMSIVDSYRKFMERNSDPRTENWWLMSGPGPLLTLLATYLYFCTSVGPRYMRDRKPYDLKNTMIVYNVSQILMSIFLVYEGLVAGWWNDYDLSCQPVDYSDSPKARRMAAAVWWYFAAKIIELLDTIFFVLRKKNNQISFLHLYHHFMMPICAWIGVKFLPGGHGTLLGVINSFIHIIMYTYYLISGLGPQYQKYLWWKKHVTTLQLIQFCIIFYHNFSVMFSDCNYPKGINFLLTLNAGLFLYMFGMFYYNSYVKGRKAAAKAAREKDAVTSSCAKEAASASNNGVAKEIVSNGKAKECYEEVMRKNERTRDMFPSALTLMIILPLYLLFCTKLGPRLMKNVRPFELRTPIYYFNLFQIFICSYIMYLGYLGGWGNGYSFQCQPVDWTENDQTRAMINACWWYCLVKLIDLMDTVFFVLRKKDRQISFLHLFHHFMMPIASFIALKYFPNGHATLLGWINCFVHIVMYTYYLIAGLGPQYQKYLWWKKHVTSLQIIQFSIIFVHNMLALLNGCDYPKWINVLLCIESTQFIYMFGSFYYNNYIKTPQPKSNGAVKAKSEKAKAR